MDRFLSIEAFVRVAETGQVLMCAHHSALFRFEDGVCIDGPCAGHRLDSVDLEIADGVVRVA